MRLVIRQDSAPTPGDVRAMGRGDTLTVHRPATLRPDWGSLAAMIAYARGAHVELTDDPERMTSHD